MIEQGVVQQCSQFFMNITEAIIAAAGIYLLAKALFGDSFFDHINMD